MDYNKLQKKNLFLENKDVFQQNKFQIPDLVGEFDKRVLTQDNISIKEKLSQQQSTIDQLTLEKIQIVKQINDTNKIINGLNNSMANELNQDLENLNQVNNQMEDAIQIFEKKCNSLEENWKKLISACIEEDSTDLIKKYFTPYRSPEPLSLENHSKKINQIKDFQSLIELKYSKLQSIDNSSRSLIQNSSINVKKNQIDLMKDKIIIGILETELFEKKRKIFSI